MQTTKQWLQAEPFSLALSGGYLCVFAYCGILEVLEEHRLYPNFISGCSAGAMAAGYWAAGLSAKQITNHVLNYERKDVWDPWIGFGLLRGKKLRNMIDKALPVKSIEQCRWPLALSSYDVFSRKTKIHTQGNLIKAIAASNSVPGLFQPVWINKRPQLDGGVKDPWALNGIPESHRVCLIDTSSKDENYWQTNQPKHFKALKRLRICELPKASMFDVEKTRERYEVAKKWMAGALGES